MLKNTEEVTEKMIQQVVSACEKYRQVQAAEQKAKAELHEHEKAEATTATAADRRQKG